MRVPTHDEWFAVQLGCLWQGCIVWLRIKNRLNPNSPNPIAPNKAKRQTKHKANVCQALHL